MVDRFDDEENRRRRPLVRAAITRRPAGTSRADRSATRGGAEQSAGPSHPAVVAYHRARRTDRQLRAADAITAFAGSLPFVYAHAVAFGLWMLLMERSPWPTLTLFVSLEAIFLSSFVMIGQNRQAEFQRAKADHDFVEQELELKANTELTRAIHVLAIDLHDHLVGSRRPSSQPGSCEPDDPEEKHLMEQALLSELRLGRRP